MMKTVIRAESAAQQKERLGALRAELSRRGLDGFLIPRADEHQGEYVAPRSERLSWLTGFDGSAGFAVVLKDKAAIFVDGRYTLQARDQVDSESYEIRHVPAESPHGWLAANLAVGATVGFDPWLHPPAAVDRFRSACAGAGAELVAVDGNPLDAVWTDQPGPPLAPVVPHGLEYAGRPAAEKRAEIGATLARAGIDATVLTLPDSIAWLFNIRGADVPRTPLPHAFALVAADGSAMLFLDPRKASPGLAEHLGDDVAIAAPEELGQELDALKGRSIQIDGATAPQWVFDRLEKAGAAIRLGDDPCQLPKARKNEVELAGIRAAHRRDGAALTKFLAWLDGAAANGGVTEIEAADRLEAFRRESNLMRDLSFDTISGAGPNGAIVHYRVTERTDRALEANSLYLVDSGAQYPDGTTDVTRTVAVGAPTPEMRRHFTLVLKGHIALATARFPKGTSGSQLDALARLPLWRAGLDYDHGTGHGVGAYLSVHEGPQRISKMPNSVALEPGMIVSNEPGYYKEGAYGIRIENLVAVTEAEAVGDSGERPMLGFETLTLAPIDRRLIDIDILTEDERAWLNAYHAEVRETLSGQMDGAGRTWLEAATAPL